MGLITKIILAIVLVAVLILIAFFGRLPALRYVSLQHLLFSPAPRLALNTD